MSQHTPIETWLRYQKNPSPYLRNRIAEQNLGLARRVARDMEGDCPEPFEDLVQIAAIGLIRAIERYNPNQGAAFSSFAMPYVRGEVLHFLRDHWGTLKIPRKLLELVQQIKKDHRLTEGYTIERVALAHGLLGEDWRWLLEATQRRQLVDIDEHPIAHEEGEELEQDSQNQLFKIIHALPKRYYECVTAIYYQKLSIAQIARKQGRSAEEVEKLLAEALLLVQTKLHEPLNNCRRDQAISARAGNRARKRHRCSNGAGAADHSQGKTLQAELQHV